MPTWYSHAESTGKCIRRREYSTLRQSRIKVKATSLTTDLRGCGDLQRDVEKEVSGKRVRRLWQPLCPEHGTSIPGRLGVDLHLDALLLALRYRN